MSRRFYSVVACAAFAIVAAQPAAAMEVEEFVKIAKSSMKKVKRSKVRERTIDELIDQQKELIRIGVEGCLEFAEKSPADAKMMHLVVLNSKKMQDLSLDEIESEWHRGDYLRSHGIDVDRFAKTDAQTNYYESIVNPATAIIALHQYKRSKDPQLLDHVYNSLAEVVQTVESLK